MNFTAESDENKSNKSQPGHKSRAIVVRNYSVVISLESCAAEKALIPLLTDRFTTFMLATERLLTLLLFKERKSNTSLVFFYMQGLLEQHRGDNWTKQCKNSPSCSVCYPPPPSSVRGIPKRPGMNIKLIRGCQCLLIVNTSVTGV